jgi:lambda repressor-like predicted transcriptional regulator
MSVKAVAEAASAHVREQSWAPPSLVGTTRVRRLLATDLDAMIADYENGMGCVLLSRKYDIAENTVLARLRQAGVTVRSVRAPDLAQVEWMASLRDEGWTLTEIGDRYGLTRQTVANRLKRASVSHLPSRRPNF